MSTLFVVFGFMLLVVAGMAVGVIFSNKPIKGSCGGMNAIGMDGACDICGDDPNKCKEQSEKAAEVAPSANFYDATKR